MRIIAGIGGEESATAIQVFLERAKPSTEVMAIAVVPRHSRLSAVLDFSPRHGHQHLQKLRKLEQDHASELLAGLKAKVERPGVKVETSVLFGNPAEHLIKAAQEWRADLLLVTRREGTGHGLSHLGHVARRVARYASCTVILLDPEQPAPQVLVLATDGSPQAEEAGERLRQMPVQGSPTLLVCTVMPTVSPAFIKSGSLDYREYQRLLSEIEEQEKEAARKILDRSAATFKGTTFKVRELAYTGDTAQVLLRVIRESNVDLLALGAKGISAAAEFLLGSVTLKLLNRAPCSILVAR